MGASKVGKSSLITQFLYSRYTPKYKRTIEEMHQGNFNVAGVGLTLDILDTSGSNEVSVASLALLPLQGSRKPQRSAITARDQYPSLCLRTHKDRHPRRPIHSTFRVCSSGGN